MAVFPYDDDGGPDRIEAATWLNWAGAALSVTLVAGLAAWGWQLLERDVSGVPVVRAMEGPMRIAPEDPGGSEAAHQGLAVNSVAAEDEGARAEHVVLAPPPVSLAPEDRPAAILDAVAEAARKPEEAVPARIAGTDLAVAEALAAIEEEDLGLTAGGAPEPGEELAARGPGIAASPRPAVRPERLSAVTPVSATLPAPGEIDPAAIPAGTRMVQLGAFESPEVARRVWGEMTDRFSAYMVGKNRVVARAETGGRVFWRLRATGFSDLADARRFCAVLVAEGANCIPVIRR